MKVVAETDRSYTLVISLDIRTGGDMLSMNATEFKAHCLALIDQVHRTGEPIVITKHGKVVARIVKDDAVSVRPYEELRGTGRFVSDVFAPVVSETEIEALRPLFS